MTMGLPTSGDHGDASMSGTTSAKLASEDKDTLALYLAPTRDFDDMLGLLIIGNAFGKLVLYSYSAIPSQTLAGCF